MAAFNVSLDDASPLITYSPANVWTDTPANDTSASHYVASSLHTTSVKGATASFSFNGTGIWLYGGFRSNYGSYMVTVDGMQIMQGSAKSSQTQFKRVLGGVRDLKMGAHKVVLTSEGGGPIDLDSVVFQSAAGTTGMSVTSTDIDDINSKITYGPATSDWSVTNGSSFFDDSLHFSTTRGAYASLLFTGNAVALYGTVDPQHANYTVALDGVTSEQMNPSSSVSTLHAQTLLYFAEGLESAKQHTITLTGYPGTKNDQYFDMDYITVYSATASTSSSASHTSALPTSTTPSNNNASPTVSPTANIASSFKLSTGALIGIIVGCIALLLLLLLALLLFVRHRRAQAKGGPHPRSAKPDEPSPSIPIQNPPDLEAAYDYALHEKELSPEDLRPSLEIHGRPSVELYGNRAETARLQAYSRPSTPQTLRGSDEDGSMGRGRMSPFPVSPGRGRLSPFPASPVGGLSPYPASPRSGRFGRTSPYLASFQAGGLGRTSPYPVSPVPTVVINDEPLGSGHVRTTSETSTVVTEEVEAGLSEIILSPSRSQRRPPASPRSPNTARPKDNRATQFSALQYYYEA